MGFRREWDYIMDQLCASSCSRWFTDEVRQESLWTMMSADDVVICSESREEVEESL